jgi:hypothetical protein
LDGIFDLNSIYISKQPSVHSWCVACAPGPPFPTALLWDNFSCDVGEFEILVGHVVWLQGECRGKSAAWLCYRVIGRRDCIMGALWAVKEQRGARGARTVSVQMLTWRYGGNIRSRRIVRYRVCGSREDWTRFASLLGWRSKTVGYMQVKWPPSIGGLFPPPKSPCDTCASLCETLRHCVDRLKFGSQNAGNIYYLDRVLCPQKRL